MSQENQDQKGNEGLPATPSGSPLQSAEDGRISAAIPKPTLTGDPAEIPDFTKMPIEQVEAYLRSEGLDPDEEREHGRKVIERLKARMNEKPWHPSCPRYPSDGPCNCG